MEDLEQMAAVQTTAGGDIALGFSLRTMLDNGSELVLHSCIDRDAPVEVINDVLDKCASAAHRQRKAVALVSARANLKLQLRDLETAQRRLVVAEEEYTTSQAARADRIVELRAEQAQIASKDATELAAKGRRPANDGDFKLSSSAQRQFEARENAIAAMEREIENAGNERSNAIKSSQAEQRSYMMQIEYYQNEIAELEAFLGG